MMMICGETLLWHLHRTTVPRSGVKGPRDAAFLPSERSLDVTLEEVASQIEDEAKSSSYGGEDYNQ